MAKQEGKAQEPEWQHLTREEREERRARVRAWMKLPDHENAHQPVDDLLELAVDNLIGYAFKRFYQPEAETRTSEAAGSWAKASRDELRTLVRQNKDATRAVLETTMNWWQTEKKTGKSGDVDFLIERCADQGAAGLVLKNLPPAEETKTRIWWDVVLHRTAERIIVPRLWERCKDPDLVNDNRLRNAVKGTKWKLLQALASEDCAEDCKLAIYESAKGFTYQGLDKAIKWFTNACLWNMVRQVVPVPTVSLSELELAESMESRPVRTPSSLTVPSELEQIIERHEDELTRQLRRERLWSIREQVDQEVVLRLWILFILKEDRQRGWDEIAELVLQPRCGILSDDDLPPDVSWDEVQGAFQAMAQRSRTSSCRLTSAALRKFYSRTI